MKKDDKNQLQFENVFVFFRSNHYRFNRVNTDDKIKFWIADSIFKTVSGGGHREGEIKGNQPAATTGKLSINQIIANTDTH